MGCGEAPGVRSGAEGGASRSSARSADSSDKVTEAAAEAAARVDSVSVDARQANDLIERRTFSWTELFNRFEHTLPDDVRITTRYDEADFAALAPTEAASVSWNHRARSTIGGLGGLGGLLSLLIAPLVYARRATIASASSAAASVCSMTAASWAVERKPASNCDGAR